MYVDYRYHMNLMNQPERVFVKMDIELPPYHVISKERSQRVVRVETFLCAKLTIYRNLQM